MPSVDRQLPASALFDSRTSTSARAPSVSTLSRLNSIPGYARHQAGCAGHVYNEAAFRHFLDVDRVRAQRAIRTLLLVLINLRQQPASVATFSDATAGAIFTGLGDCVREIDFVGWYREGKMPAAALVMPNAAAEDMRRRMADRIVRALRIRLRADTMRSIRVRVFKLGRIK